MIKLSSKGDFKKTRKFLKKMTDQDYLKGLEKYGEEGVRALSQATPVRSGKTADSWSYRVSKDGKSFKIEFLNSNRNKGVMIAIILQYGHGTRNGGYVQGIDYINPAIQPIFDKIAEEAWKEVTNA